MTRGALPLPRHIRPENLQIGDTIRVTWSFKGIERSHTATIAERSYSGQDRIYSTAEGATIFSWNPSLPHPTITLLARAGEVQPTLFDMREGA
jgi:hypothetical protein